MVDPFDLMALFRAGMAFMAALNLVFALMIFSRHCGTPVRKSLIMLARIEILHAFADAQHQLQKRWQPVSIAAACVL